MNMNENTTVLLCFSRRDVTRFRDDAFHIFLLLSNREQLKFYINFESYRSLGDNLNFSFLIGITEISRFP